MADDTNKSGAKPAAPAKAGATTSTPRKKAPAKRPAAGAGITKAKITGAAETLGKEASKAKATATETIKDSASKLTKQASEKARYYAEDGKAKAGGALDEFSRLMDNAASSVDDRLGNEYGDYARSAAKAISGFSDSLKSKNIDDLIADARDFARKSPAVAIGTAAAVGFVLARLVKSGLDAADRDA